MSNEEYLAAAIADLRARTQRLERLEFMTRRSGDVAWSRAVGMIKTLPALVGFWPLGSTNLGSTTPDLSGMQRHLTLNGSPVIQTGGRGSYMKFASASSEYLNFINAAQHQISGTESWVHSTLRGLTIGGYWRVTTLGNQQSLAGKYVSAGNQRSYLLSANVSSQFQFTVSSDGTAGGSKFVVNTGLVGMSNTWFYGVGRFTPSSEIKNWVNLATAVNVTSIPASLFNSTADFEVARYDLTNYLTGHASLVWLCAAALPDSMIEELFEATRALFGL